MNVGETSAQAVVRETLEETGVHCQAVALVGVYDSRLWKPNSAFHAYMFTFLCEPIGDGQRDACFQSIETLEIDWFCEGLLPDKITPDHYERIQDAFGVWRGEPKAFFDP